MLQYVSHFFPTGTTFTRRRGTISSINVSQIAQEKRGERFFYNGVDITKFTRRYSCDKWLKSKNLWPKIQAEKDKKASPKESKNKSPRPADKQAKAMQKEIKSLSRKVAALQQSEGLVATTTTANSNETYIADEDDEATGPRAYGKKHKASSLHKCRPPIISIGPIKSRNPLRVFSTLAENKHIQNDSRPLDYSSYLDEDSHADMHCAGANFSIIKFSGYQCDVDPFLDTYTTTTGVDVVTAATAVELSAGDVLYLVSLAALWFGDQMEISLFNGNILWDAGIELCTDPP